MDFAISAAQWVLGKALAPLMDGMLEAWAASKNLGLNMGELKMELLYAQGMLDHAQGREIHSPALKELLHKLQQLAYDSDDVLDELDYFRIQDELEGTFEAADMDARGSIQDTALHAKAVAVAQARKVMGQDSRTDAIANGPPDQHQEEARQRQRAQPEEKPAGGVRRLAYNARHTIGKHFLCCTCSPLVQADGDSGTMETTMSVLQKESIVDAPTPPVQAGGDSSTLDTITSAVPVPQQEREDVVDPPNKLVFQRVEMSSRMKAIVEELKPLCAKVSIILNLELLHSSHSIAQVIAAELRVAHLKEQGNNTLAILPENDVKTRPKTTSDTSEPTIFFGRGDETTKIKNIITGHRSSHNDLIVLPIVGLGGMGKTTLAQHIYKEAEKDFDLRIWACVSTDFSVPRLLKDILESESLHELSKELRGTPPEKQIEQVLTSKRFLLVLDDVWDTVNNDGWDRLLAPFRKSQTKGNMVLVTTRSPSVAHIVKVKTTDSTIELEGLDQKAFREFFQSCVFGSDNKSKEDHKELDGIGEEIMIKLKGSPLAAKTVGRLLRNNLDQNHWKRVLDSKEWELQTGDSDIMPALRLSYDFLPFHLQRCFSYCALFPEDYMFTSQELIHWWIGLDILQPGPENKSIEEIGQVYLDDLVDHGFITKRQDTYIRGRLHGHGFIIHDLLHDLGLKVASRECLSLNSSSVVSAEIWPSIRHVSIIIDKDNADDEIIPEFISGLRELLLGRRLKIENLQTLMAFGLDENFTVFIGDLIKKASGLRVISLEGMLSHIEFPTLTHLRYLRLESELNDKFQLPSMLSRFYHLRILNLEQQWITRGFHLPRDLSNLTKLRHFVGFPHLESGICNVGKLQLLQELRRFVVNRESTGFELKQLGKLNELRELGIYNLQEINTTEEAAAAKLVDKKCLQKLELEWRNNCDVEGLVLEGLQPPRNLQELCIRLHGSLSCPSWLVSSNKQHSLKALRSLTLEIVDWEFLPSLGHMEILHDLKLHYMTRLKELGPAHFGRIKNLKLMNLSGLEKWVPGDDHCHFLSSLEELTIHKCPLVMGSPLVSLVIQREPPSNLRWLETDDFTGALAQPICTALSSSLPMLILHGNYVERFTKQQEDALVLLTSIQHLRFDYFPNLQGLPAGLHRLRNLKKLRISHCKSLRSLPEDGLPSSLQELDAKDSYSEELKQACTHYIHDHPGIKLQI